MKSIALWCFAVYAFAMALMVAIAMALGQDSPVPSPPIRPGPPPPSEGPPDQLPKQPPPTDTPPPGSLPPGALPPPPHNPADDAPPGAIDSKAQKLVNADIAMYGHLTEQYSRAVAKQTTCYAQANALSIQFTQLQRAQFLRQRFVPATPSLNQVVQKASNDVVLGNRQLARAYADLGNVVLPLTAEKALLKAGNVDAVVKMNKTIASIWRDANTALSGATSHYNDALSQLAIAAAILNPAP